MTSKIDSVLEFLNQSRYLEAKRLWNTLSFDEQQIYLDENKKYVDSRGRLLKSQIEEMNTRSIEVERALIIADVDPSWTLGLTYLGITTHYCVDKDGLIAIRMEGILEDLPIFEQCAVVHEVDLFKEWVPFCKESICVEKVGNAEILAYILIQFTAISRDCLISGFGADCLQEHGSIVIIAQSIDDWSNSNIPIRQKSWRHDRADIKDIAAIINILSPSTAKTIITAKVDIHSILPQSIINFIIRNIAGVGLYFFQQQSLKVSQNPNCSHSKRIQDNKEFYEIWLYPKLRDYCLSKGWEAPIVQSLGHKPAKVKP